MKYLWIIFKNIIKSGYFQFCLGIILIMITVHAYSGEKWHPYWLVCATVATFFWSFHTIWSNSHHESNTKSNDVSKKRCSIEEIIENRVKKFKKGYSNHKYLIMLIFVIMCTILFFLGIWYFSGNQSAFDFWFTTGKDGENKSFQWVGISAAIAGIGLIINSIGQNKKLKADLVSKSRVEWINDISKLIAEYLTLTNKKNFEERRHRQQVLRYQQDQKKLTTIQKTIKQNKKVLSMQDEALLQQQRDKLDQRQNKAIDQEVKINDLNQSIINIQNQLTLRISNAEDNKELRTAILRVTQSHKKYGQVVKAFTGDPLGIQKDVDVQTAGKDAVLARDNLNKVGKEYFKREWEIVKSLK